MKAFGRHRQQVSHISMLWLVLALLALGLAALGALALVVARTPGVSGLVSAAAFQRALVVHVNLATLIWFLAMACSLWTESTSARPGMLRLGFGLSLAGALGIVAIGLAGRGAAVLANYLPHLDSRAFLLAQACFAAGVLATALASLRRPRGPGDWGLLCSVWPLLMGAIDMVLQLRDGAGLEEALWSAGHLLQFSYITILMTIWWRMAGADDRRSVAPAVTIALFIMAAAPATLPPLLHLLSPTPGGNPHAAYSALMAAAGWPPAILLGLALLIGVRHRRGALDAEAVVGVPASFAMIVVGCLVGSAITGETTVIPAHYHGTVGAVTVALMAYAQLRVRRAAGVEMLSPLARVPLLLYGTGLLLLIAGLAWSGTLGTVRKLPFDAVAATLPVQVAAALTGLGGACAVAGVGLFVMSLLRGVLCLWQAKILLKPPHCPGAASTSVAGR